MSAPRTRIAAALLAALALAGPVVLSAQDAEPWRSVLKLGVGLEYFTRTLVWDADSRSSPLAAGFAVARLDTELLKGFTLGACLGYGLSSFNGLIFRALPFSLDYEAGSSGSFLAGIGAEAMLIKAGDFEIGILGRYVLSLGGTRTLAVPDLNASGSAGAKATWMRIQAGPVLRYTGYQDFAPFVALTYDRLWGTFTMTETVQELTGTEDKAIAGAGSIGALGGFVYEPAPGFSLRAEIGVIPYSKLAGGLGFDFSGSLKAVLAF